MKTDDGKLLIVDAHCHIYPSKIAAKAVNAIGDFYGVPMGCNGTVDSLVAEGKAAGISRFVVHSTATTMHQVERINDYIFSETEAHPEFIGFITLHQDMTEESVAEAVDLAIKRGMKGIKLHPDFQHFNIDEAENIYKGVDGRLPILLHMGDKRYDYSSPNRLKKMADKYKNQTFIAAHFGGYSVWDKVECLNECDNVVFDTSSSLAWIGKDRARELISLFGAERMMFGSDYPMWKHDEELERFYNLALSDRENEMILGENAVRIIGLK